MSISSLIVAIAFLAGLGLGIWKHQSLLSWISPARRERRNRRVTYEDALKHIYKLNENDEQATVLTVAGQLEVSVDEAASILSALQSKKLVDLQKDAIRLSARGKEYARHIIRAHRLWERYLADMTGVPELEWHGEAERFEHKLTAEDLRELSARLGNPTHDPHGDPVPSTAGVATVQAGGQSLRNLAAGESARITHVEDEPRSVYAELVEKNIFPGMDVRLVEKSSEGFVIRSEGRDEQLTPLAAENITVQPAPPEREETIEGSSRMSELTTGQKARVILLSRSIRPVERRRFMDLGLLPGTLVTAEFAGPSGDPIAFNIRGAVVALRKEQAENVLVEVLEEESAA